MNGNSPTFSTSRKWALSLNVALAVVSALAILVMVNYLAARHFKRLSFAGHAPVELSPLTHRVLANLTNEVKVIIYFDKQEALYDPVQALLKEYKFANGRISVDTVDYLRDPATANLIKAKYKLSQTTEKNLIIFDSPGRQPRFVYDSELSEFDMSQLMSGQSREVRRKAFKGEVLFTSAILGVINPRQLKAYFLQGHNEHRPDSDDALTGYSKFAAVLRENNIQMENLSLLGTTEVPTDCHLLIVAGPTDPLLNEELEKIDRYLRQGGRMLVLFRPAIFSPMRQLGLEKILATWGVAVGNDVVVDLPSAVSSQNDMLVRHFSNHALIRPLFHSGLYLLMPRSVRKLTASPSSDAPQVEVLATSSPSGHVHTDIRKSGEFYATPTDEVGQIPFMVAVERGSIRGVSPDRGSTRMVVVGESIFLGNKTIDQAANREFVTHALNWLLARNELLASIPPQPIKEYKLVMSISQISAVYWILMLGFPGSVLMVGLLVSVRRRK